MWGTYVSFKGPDVELLEALDSRLGMSNKVKVTTSVGARNVHQHVATAGVVVQIARDIINCGRQWVP